MLAEEIDILDLRLLRRLAHNSRISVRSLASQLGIPHTTLYSRIRRLERLGVIKRYTIMPDLAKLGYTITAVTSVSVEGRYIEELEETVSRRTETVAVYDITGEYDMLIVAKFRGIGELDSFIKWLNKQRGVRRTETSVVFRIVKEDLASPLIG